ncbi:unnamed protein product [Amoebophrya sp. A25]|nr:unnamed protein product [Amoebophrya sp. A25]|eukprot:GSA25T00027535001.1
MDDAENDYSEIGEGVTTLVDDDPILNAASVIPVEKARDLLRERVPHSFTRVSDSVEALSASRLLYPAGHAEEMLGQLIAELEGEKRDSQALLSGRDAVEEASVAFLQPCYPAEEGVRGWLAAYAPHVLLWQLRRCWKAARVLVFSHTRKMDERSDHLVRLEVRRRWEKGVAAEVRRVLSAILTLTAGALGTNANGLFV